LGLGLIAPGVATERREDSLRVAFFLHGLEAGGAQKRTAQLVSSLSALGVAVELVVVDAVGPNLSELSAEVRVVELRSPFTRLPWIRARRSRRLFAAVPALVGFLRRSRPDVWVASANHTHFAALLAQRLAHVESTALVLRLSNTLVDGRSWSSRRSRLWAARRFYRHADAIAVVAPGLREELVRLMPDLAERAWLMINPVIDESVLRRAQDDPDPRWGLDRSALVVGVGRLVPQKDFSTLVRAFAALRCDRPTRLLILGEGPERAALEQLVGELGIRDRVALAGFTPNPFPALRRADVVVSSSRWEGLPGVLIEALALGRPVVATDTPSVRAVLGEHSPHPVVPSGDVAAMARAIEAQLSNPAPGEVSRRKAEGFSVEAGARAMLGLLREVSARHRSGEVRAPGN